MKAEQERYRLLLVAASLEGGLAHLAWGLGWLLGQPIERQLHWNLPDLLLGVLASLPLFLLLVLCLQWPIGPLDRIRRFSEEIIRPLFAPCSWLELAAISLLAGLGEEMLFRGLIQGAVGRWLGRWTGLAVASVFFGLLHPITLTYALLATVMGAFLGWLYAVNGNLLVVIVAHSLYDFVALVVLVRQPGPLRRQTTVSAPPPLEELSGEHPAHDAG